MSLAWYPKGIVAPPELTAVSVKKGILDDKLWIEALSDRVTDLALKEEDPLKSAQQACQVLNLPLVDEANQLGELIVKNNLNLRTNLNCLTNKEPFPAKVNESNPEAQLAMNETDLARWVDLAAAQVSVSDLD
jgi:hypothetical protein